MAPGLAAVAVSALEGRKRLGRHQVQELVSDSPLRRYASGVLQPRQPQHPVQH